MLGVSNLTVQFFEVVLAGPDLVLDNESVRSGKVGHGARVESPV